jgi:preprotein translocase subunit SecF
LALLLFGGQAIHSFTATMMFGVVLVGTYTSVFIASPILIYLGVGSGRMGEAEEPDPLPEPQARATLPPPQRARARR